jgi:Dit-like phage tail protein
MALFQLLFGRNVKKGFVTPENQGSTAIIGLELDATILEAPEFTSVPTKNVIESGADVTDHVTNDPISLSIEGIVTNTPVGIFQSLRALTSTNAWQDALNFLLKLWEDRVPFDFVGGLQVYENMIITNFSPTRTPRTGDALEFRMTMKQIKTIETEVVAITKFSEDIKHSGQKEQSLGSQPTEAATAKAQEKGSSVLAKWLPNFLGGGQ